MDILIKNAIILTMDNGCVIKGCIGIDGNLITYIGAETLEATRTIDAKGKIVMPGLINTHTHMPMSILRGYADDLNLQDWLFNHIFPAEDKMTSQDAYWATLLSICEMIASGTTTFCDMYFFSEEIIKATLESGMRADIGRALTDVAGEQSGAERLCEAKELYTSYHSDKIHINLAPHAVYTCSQPYVRKIVDLGNELNARIHTHISETEAENIECLEKHGMTPTQYYKESGLFDLPVLAAHSVFLTDEDTDIYTESGASIAHNPCSNLKLASGVAPLQKYQDKGINIALGTDGAASNNNLNMFKEIQLSATIHKGTTRIPTLVPAAKALEFATVNGAKALGRQDEIGVLKIGMKADMIFIDTDKPHMNPIHNPISSIVYSAMASDVSDVMIDGQFVYENREYKTLDCDKILFEIRRIKNATYNS